MKKLAIGIVAVLALSGSAFAGGWQFKDNTTYDQSNPIGQTSAQITHNGWSVGNGKAAPDSTNVYEGADQTTSPGSRAGLVQGALGHDVHGQGSTNGVGNSK